jgi:hypothetical protein
MNETPYPPEFQIMRLTVPPFLSGLSRFPGYLKEKITYRVAYALPKKKLFGGGTMLYQQLTPFSQRAFGMYSALSRAASWEKIQRVG